MFLFWTDCIYVHLHQDSNIGSYQYPTPELSRIQVRKDVTRAKPVGRPMPHPALDPKFTTPICVLALLRRITKAPPLSP
jgi:hypothetical protein